MSVDADASSSELPEEEVEVGAKDGYPQETKTRASACSFENGQGRCISHYVCGWTASHPLDWLSQDAMPLEDSVNSDSTGC